MTTASALRTTVVAFTSADSVYILGYHSDNGGQIWQPFGPPDWYSGDIVFNPVDPQIAYVGDERYGVWKTTDGGQTWEIQNQGLAGMVCNMMEVSRHDPLRIYGMCSGWPGIYLSQDGAIHWSFIPLGDFDNKIRAVREDPFDPQRIYAAGDKFNESKDGGTSWSSHDWNLSPPVLDYISTALAADPFQPGRLLLGLRGPGDYGLGPALVYSSSDHGASWEGVFLPQGISGNVMFTFDPETEGLVYLSTGGTGLYRSANSGASWTRIDDQHQPDMRYLGAIAIATHPQPAIVALSQVGPYRSLDGGVTWQKTRENPGGYLYFMFIGGDSTRLYSATGSGLCYSSDLGDTWHPAAGSLGRLQIMSFGYAQMESRTILYAATNGGTAETAESADMYDLMGSSSNENNLVDAGIYRYVQIIRQIFLPLINR